MTSMAIYRVLFPQFAELGAWKKLIRDKKFPNFISYVVPLWQTRDNVKHDLLKSVGAQDTFRDLLFDDDKL